jgi:AbrB family looped-hinge helix DNA binding protein
MKTAVTADEARGVVLPEHLREELGLQDGDALEVETSGGEISLKPVRAKARMK